MFSVDQAGIVIPTYELYLPRWSSAFPKVIQFAKQQRKLKLCLRKIIIVLGICSIVGGCSLPATQENWAYRSGPVKVVTTGPGNDTEAAWSQDGKRIAFQTDLRGDLDIDVLNLGDGSRITVVEGPGHACYPAWTEDGGLVYAFGHHAGTAVQAAQASSDSGYGLRLWKDGATRVLTQGYWRDYTPSVSADGKSIYYSSTQGVATSSEAASWREHTLIRRLGLQPDAISECVLPLSGTTKGAVQPSCSSNGQLLVWAYLDGVGSNWRICVARTESPIDSVCLTPNEMSGYAPRWSPDGRLIAFTGFRQGDPGWGIYLMDPRADAMTRLDTGAGNSRSAAWSPDGRELVFENNRSGCYKLYRISVRCGDAPPPGAQPDVAGVDRVEARFEQRGSDAALISANGQVVKGMVAGGSALTFEAPSGLDFGLDPFFVRLTMIVNAVGKEVTIAAVGNYAVHPLGWQVFINPKGHLAFSPRGATGGFLQVLSKQPVVLGQPIDVLCIRDAGGSARLYLDGIYQGQCDGAQLEYGPALKLSLGQQFSGGMALDGRILAFDCGRGYPAGVPRLPTRESIFGESVQ